MNGILEYLSKGDIVFPMEQERERAFGIFGDRVQKEREQLETLLEGNALEQVMGYLTSLEEFHDWERQLAYSRIALELRRTEMAVVQQLLAMNLLTASRPGRFKRAKKERCICYRCPLKGCCPYGGNCRHA